MEGNLKGDQKQDLVAKLENQLDDSLQAKTVSSFYKPMYFIVKKLSYAPVFDSTYLGHSTVYMNALLNSNGYYAPVI